MNRVDYSGGRYSGLEERKEMKNGKAYWISFGIILIIAIIIINVILVNEDVSVKSVGTTLCVVLVGLSGLIGRKSSDKIIEKGDSINSAPQNMIYYFVMFLFSIIVAFGCPIVLYIVLYETGVLEFIGLGGAILCLLLLISLVFFLLVPYVLAMVGLIVRKIVK